MARGASFVALTAAVACLVTGLAAMPRVRVDVARTGDAADDVARAIDTADDVARAIDAAYQAAYDLDLADALGRARAVVAAAPRESRAHRTLASMVWLELLFRRGAMTVDYFMGGLTKSQMLVPKPPADLDAEFKRAIAEAERLAEVRLAQRPDDISARYDLGAAYGIQASYSASIEGSMTAAFAAARRAYDAHERVLARSPQQLDAAAIIGTYRYTVAALALPARMFAYIMGFGGGKERGISMIESAKDSPESKVSARTALLLIYSREGRHTDAIRVLTELEAAHPRNRLFILEQGAAEVRAGRAADAEATLNRGLAVFEHDTRPKIPGELSLWLYKRGLARLGQNHRPEATADFDAAIAAGPADWIRARITLEFGKLADLSGDRARAMTKYREARDMSAASNDPVSVSEAERYLRQPFKMAS